MPHDSVFYKDEKYDIPGTSDSVFETPGVITAKKKNLDGCAAGFGKIPRACGSFEWTGGNVYGHNIDINMRYLDNTDDANDRDILFSPFLNLSRLAKVTITGIKFEHNFMLSNYGKMPSLLTI